MCPSRRTISSDSPGSAGSSELWSSEFLTWPTGSSVDPQIIQSKRQFWGRCLANRSSAIGMPGKGGTAAFVQLSDRQSRNPRAVSCSYWCLVLQRWNGPRNDRPACSETEIHCALHVKQVSHYASFTSFFGDRCFIFHHWAIGLEREWKSRKPAISGFLDP